MPEKISQQRDISTQIDSVKSVICNIQDLEEKNKSRKQTTPTLTKLKVGNNIQIVYPKRNQQRVGKIEGKTH